MMKRCLIALLIIGMTIVAACSDDSQNSEKSADKAESSTEELSTNSSDSGKGGNNSGQDSAATDQTDNQSNEENTGSQNKEGTQSDRKIIYTANLRIAVKNYQKTVESIQAEVSDRGGYIVESAMHEGGEDGRTTGQVKARVPQEQFETFIQTVEDGSNRVMESSTSGRDVTEEYVDLESRLESKRTVEKRLKTFMEQADKTEDLLKISEDLAKVQQEIEDITGRMKYLDNKVNLATVTIHIEEKNVSISSEEDLNTWGQTKQLFLQSINFLLSAFSGLFVFIAGSSPVLLILAVVGAAIFWVVRRRQRKDG